MRAECLPLSHVPHTTKLFADFLIHSETVRNFFPQPPDQLGWIAEHAGTLVYDSGRRQQIADILLSQNGTWGASAATLERIERFRAGAMAVVTGQQVSLFGGPLFSLYKALTAIKVAEIANRQGIPAVPIFWLATEDHDLDEISAATVLASDGSLARLATASQGSEGAPVSDVRLSADVSALVLKLRQLLGDSEVVEHLAEAYQPGRSFGDAFARLFTRLFADFGVILIDGADPRLHQIASPVYRAAVAGAQDINEAQRERDRALEAAGYHRQVKVTPATTLLFGVQKGARIPIHRLNGRFGFGEERLSESELLQRIASEPENFSGNVLLRPVVQDFLLPTLAYVGGPSEVAYFAQAAVVYEQLLGRVTPVLPRLSATVVEPRMHALLSKYGITVADVLQREVILGEFLSQRTLPTQVADAFAGASLSLEQSLSQLRAPLQRLDPTLVAAADKAHAKMRYQLERIRGRAARAQLRRGDEISRHAARLVDSLYPYHDLQERGLAGVGMLARHGTALLGQIYAQLQPTCADHHLFYL